jgi:hypothetical protein
LKKQLAICAGLWLLGFGAAGSAGAQAVYVGPELSDPALPPYEIMSIVRSTGLTPLTRPMRRGPYYVLVAVDRVGRQMRVVVDAQLGDIVNLRPALAIGSYGPEVGRAVALPGPAAPPPDTAQAPTPPRSIPNTRAVNAAPPAAPPAARVAVAEPALPPPPPLPRPPPNRRSKHRRKRQPRRPPKPRGRPLRPRPRLRRQAPPAKPTGRSSRRKTENERRPGRHPGRAS